MPKSKTPDPDPMTATLATFNPAAAQAWMEITTECARFAMERVQKGFEAQRAMMACTSPAALMQLQSNYCRDAAQDYADQASRVVELMTQAASKSAGAGTTSRKYDDIPL